MAIRLHQKRPLPLTRRLALGTWRTAGDPTVYSTLVIRMEKALDYIRIFRRAKRKPVTALHLVVKAMAGIYERIPDANAIIRFNRIYLREEINIFCQVHLRDPVSGESDLSGLTLYGVNRKSLEQIVDEFRIRVKQIRRGQDPVLEGVRRRFRHVPFLLLKPFLGLLSFLVCTLNLDLRWAGLPNDPFGTLMISNVAEFGMHDVFVPLVPYSRVPTLLALGPIHTEPVVEGPNIVPAKVMRVNATFDHRIMDGARAGTMARLLREGLEDAFHHFDALE
jgi:pyruvate/2-oxoglutarate dehydrogenase complex dihydrolipoamide acyltransferase (E2) component